MLRESEAELASFVKNELYEARQEAGGCLHHKIIMMIDTLTGRSSAW